MTTWPLQSECPAFYGNPDPDGDGEPSPAWEAANLVRIVPPWQMYYANKPVKSFRIHKLCAASISRVLGVIWAHAGASQEQIERARLHLYGGSYNFRLKRGGHTLSMHSYGCAIDLDPERNGLGVPYRPMTGMMPQIAIDAFVAEGWTWGGHFSRPDCMHFQAARI